MPLPPIPSPSAGAEPASENTAALLGKLETELAATLRAVRVFGTEERTRTMGDTAWHGHWDDVGRIMLRIAAGVETMAVFVEEGGAGGPTGALETWDMIQSEDARLVRALQAIRTQVARLSPADRREWNTLARPLGLQLEAIHACAQSLRRKLERLRPGPDATDTTQADPTPHDTDYRKAALELEREQHEFSGLKDVVKGLWMWSDTPKERMRENRSLLVDET